MKRSNLTGDLGADTTPNMKFEKMKARRSPVCIVLIVVALSALFPGCGGAKKAATPEQREEMRQKAMKNADRQRREG